VSGFITKSSKEIASRIAFLYNNPDRYLEMSSNAHKYISNIAGYDKVLAQELDTIRELR
jgi:hypothetical protein